LLHEWMPITQPFGRLAQRRLKLLPHFRCATPRKRRSCNSLLTAISILGRSHFLCSPSVFTLHAACHDCQQ
jgi:hypothetical protein